jgi:diacylglycerol kinase (ATP)
MPPREPRPSSRSRLRSFRDAFSGLRHVLLTQRNAWVHALATVIVLALAAWLGVGRVELALLVLAIGMVWSAEFINTALEAAVDLASPDLHPVARIGKDVGAAAVLVASAAAAIIGFLILGPPLLARLTGA